VYWGDSRPAEALYDSERDPWNLKNLAALPEYQEQLAKMRQQLRSWLLEHRDLGFWPEPELADAEERGTPYDEARKEGVYPLERILEAAELVGAGAVALSQLRARLKDENACVRYWATVGLHALRSDARPALADLTTAMSDPSASVRIEAAWALADLDNSAAALSLLAKELENPNGFACSRAARALELLGEKARPHLAAMQEALNRPNAKEVNYSFSFSLQTAIHRLTGGSAR
jgi:HEAT repeat protein